MPAREEIHKGLATHTWEEPWDQEQKGFIVTRSWASHFLSRPHFKLICENKSMPPAPARLSGK